MGAKHRSRAFGKRQTDRKYQLPNAQEVTQAAFAARDQNSTVSGQHGGFQGRLGGQHGGFQGGGMLKEPAIERSNMEGMFTQREVLLIFFILVNRFLR